MWYNIANVFLCFQLESPVMAQGEVEIWLRKLLVQQQASLHSVIRAADLEIDDEEFDLLAFLNRFQAQVGRLNCGC